MARLLRLGSRPTQNISRRNGPRRTYFSRYAGFLQHPCCFAPPLSTKTEQIFLQHAVSATSNSIGVTRPSSCRAACRPEVGQRSSPLEARAPRRGGHPAIRVSRDGGLQLRCARSRRGTPGRPFLRLSDDRRPARSDRPRDKARPAAATRP